ncbi:MAG: glycosyltransferase family 2 protein [Myxococcota bacterium]|mgnify:CR=1 FL=1
MHPTVDLIVPVLDEAECIAEVVRGFRPGVRRVVVVDNDSTDGSAGIAAAAGAEVVSEPARGYGAACLAGIAYLGRDPPGVVAFADGDGSQDPADLASIVDPILEGRADFVVGSRTRGARDPGSVLGHAAAGNRLACAAMRLRFGVRYTDLGPMRAVRWSALETLGMSDRGYGWTVEMQVRAARAGLRIVEVPVRAHPRLGGRSKVSGTVRGTLAASAKILWVLARHLAQPG